MDQVTAYACKLAEVQNVWFGVGLRREKVDSWIRGDSESIIVMPGFVADVDIQDRNTHAKGNLPPGRDEAMVILRASGLEPSIIVESGHGLHGYWLFRQPLLIDPGNREPVKQAAANLHDVNAAAARERGWKIDNVSDLPRILRPAGTINWKDPENPKLVTFEHSNNRYDFEEIEELVGKLTASRSGFVGFAGFVPRPEDNITTESGYQLGPVAEGEFNPEDTDFPPARIGPIVNGCKWMRHCRDDAATLPEPEWHATLSVVGRCEDGERLAHEWSSPYPRYTFVETRKKVRHALEDAGPVTCTRVMELTAGAYCEECPCAGFVRSPITIGTVDEILVDLPTDSINATPVQEENDDDGSVLQPAQQSLPSGGTAPAPDNPVGSSVTTGACAPNPPASATPWPEPKVLNTTLPPVAAFDPELLPAAFRAYALDIAERMQVPIDFAAVALLVALAGAVGRRATIRPKRRDGAWTVVPNLWGGIVSRPGNLKSPLISAVFRPLRELEKAEIEAHRIQMEAYEQEMDGWLARKKKAYGTNGDGTFDEPKPEKPPCTRYTVNDATIEKLHEILKDNPQGVLLYRDELAGWFVTLDTKGRERERPFFLEGWNGDSGYTIDRIGRGTTYVEYVCLSVFGGIQPAKLQAYLADAVQGGGGDDGLAQRLQVIVWPDQESAFRNVDREPDAVAVAAVDKVFRAVTSMSVTEPFAARFDADAQELFDQWRSELEGRVRGGKLPRYLESHLAKFRSLMPSIAVLLHLADGSREVEVPLLQAQRAADWCSYLESHAQRVYSCVTGFAERAAATLGTRIQKGALGLRFSARDVQEKGWTNLTKIDTIRLALGVLQDAGWIRAVARPPGALGGRPTYDYIVNPAVRHE
jgi:putative DNA primase/helicase